MRRLAGNFGLEVSGTHSSGPPEGVGISWHRVELTDAADIEQVFRTIRPDVVVHLAAMADVGACEREWDRATDVNATATSTIARLCELQGVRLVFVSTESVLDGLLRILPGGRPAQPHKSLWSHQKAGEQQLASVLPSSGIVRTSIVYGWPAEGRRNFVPWLINRLRTGQRYVTSTEVLRTPIFVKLQVDGIALLVETNHSGVCHVAARISSECMISL